MESVLSLQESSSQQKVRPHAGWTSHNLGMRCTADLLTNLLPSLPARSHRLLVIRPGEEQHKCRGQLKRHASLATQGSGSRRPVRGVSTT